MNGSSSRSSSSQKLKYAILLFSSRSRYVDSWHAYREQELNSEIAFLSS